MSEPIKAGDTCIIINALSRSKSPNIGKTVTVGQTVGEHSQHGRIVHVTGPEVYQMDDNGTYFNAGWADTPVAWLQKADPLAPKQTTTETNLETQS